MELFVDAQECEKMDKLKLAVLDVITLKWSDFISLVLKQGKFKKSNVPVVSLDHFTYLHIMSCVHTT